MAKDTFYFSHDYNSRSDEKIRLLIRKHGILGYGIFWAIVEDLYNNANALRLDSDGIAFDLRVDKNVIESILNDFDLFVINDGFFGSLSVERRLNQRNEKSVKASESAKYRWNKLKEDANALRTQSDCNAIKERKGKENKEIINITCFSFDEFWDLYDKKTGKPKSKLLFEKTNEVEREMIKKYIPIYKANKPDVKYRKDPERFLSNRLWEDEIFQQTTTESERAITILDSENNGLIDLSKIKW